MNRSGEEIHLLRRRAGPELHGHRRRVHVVHDPRAAGPKCDAEPGAVLHDLAPDRIEGHWPCVALHALVAVAFDQPFDPHEEIGPHRLRAGVAAPHAAEQTGDQEQADRGHDQQAGQVIDVLRPELEVEEIEALVPDRQQHGLVGLVHAAMPAQPRQQVVDGEADDQHRPFESAHRTVHGLRIHPHAIGIEVIACLLPLELDLPIGLADAGHCLPVMAGEGPPSTSFLRPRAARRGWRAGACPRAGLRPDPWARHDGMGCTDHHATLRRPANARTARAP